MPAVLRHFVPHSQAVTMWQSLILRSLPDLLLYCAEFFINNMLSVTIFDATHSFGYVSRQFTWLKTLVINYRVKSQYEIYTFVCCSEHWATKYLCWMMLWQLCYCGKILMVSVTDCDFFNISKLPFSETHKKLLFVFLIAFSFLFGISSRCWIGT